MLAIETWRVRHTRELHTPGTSFPMTRKFAGEDGTELNRKWLDGMLIKRLATRRMWPMRIIFCE